MKKEYPKLVYINESEYIKVFNEEQESKALNKIKKSENINDKKEEVKEQKNETTEIKNEVKEDGKSGNKSKRSNKKVI